MVTTGSDNLVGIRIRVVRALQVPLDHLEGLLTDGRPCLLGDAVSIADCTLQAALQFIELALGLLTVL